MSYFHFGHEEECSSPQNSTYRPRQVALSADTDQKVARPSPLRIIGRVVQGPHFFKSKTLKKRSRENNQSHKKMHVNISKAIQHLRMKLLSEAHRELNDPEQVFAMRSAVYRAGP